LAVSDLNKAVRLACTANRKQKLGGSYTSVYATAWHPTLLLHPQFVVVVVVVVDDDDDITPDATWSIRNKV
jgi:hypothetical protein